MSRKGDIVTTRLSRYDLWISLAIAAKFFIVDLPSFDGKSLVGTKLALTICDSIGR